MLNAVVDCLQRLGPVPLGCLVHVGAGAGVPMDEYAALRVDRIAVVDGDPEACTELRSAGRSLGMRTRLEVIERAVGAGGPGLWHRYNLPRLDGLSEWEGLSSQYPRLRCLSRAPVATVTLESLLAELAVERVEGRVNVLVVDLPASGDALLSACPPEWLDKFDWVVRRGRADSPHAAQALVGVVEHRSTQVEPIWPATLERLEPLRRRAAALERRVAGLEERVQAAEADRDIALARAAQADTRLAEEQVRLSAAEARSATLAAERDALTGEVEQLRSQRGRIDTDLALSVAATERMRHDLAQVRVELEQLRGTAQSEQEQLRSALASAETAAVPLREELQQLRAALTDREAEMQRVVQSMVELQSEREGAVAREVATGVELDALRQRCTDAEAVATSERGAADELRRQLHDWSQVAATLGSAPSLRGGDGGPPDASTAAGIVARVLREWDERGRRLTLVESQLALLSEERARWITERDASAWLLQERQARVDELSARQGAVDGERQKVEQQLHDLQRRHDGVASECQQLRERCESLLAELRSAAAERDRLIGELRSIADDRARALAETERQSSEVAERERRWHDSELRQRVLDEELVKAQSQIELIKDLLLRGERL